MSTAPVGSTRVHDVACRHERRQTIYGGLLSRCLDCGLAFTAATPILEYGESYFVGDQGSGYDFESAFSTTLDTARFTDELDRIEAQGLRGSVLDVGCATGQFLAIAKARGWTVAGVEVSDFARERAGERTGETIHRSVGELPPGSYDVVTLHHVLEHIEDPIAFLRDEIRPRVGRRLLVEVPNFSSLASRADGPRWRDLRPEQHVSHFSPESLEQCAAAAGFRVLRVYTLWGPLWSLRSSLETIRLLPFLLRRGHPHHDEATASGPSADPDVSEWAPPTGWKQVATEASRIAFSPIVRALESAQLAERLALEAEPAGH
jgi:SAM-dependent methyltransferase